MIKIILPPVVEPKAIPVFTKANKNKLYPVQSLVSNFYKTFQNCNLFLFG